MLKVVKLKAQKRRVDSSEKLYTSQTVNTTMKKTG